MDTAGLNDAKRGGMEARGDERHIALRSKASVNNANETPVASAAQSAILTVAQLAEYLHCSPGTIYRLLYRREIPAFRLGGDWRFTRADIEEWIADRHQMAAVNPTWTGRPRGRPRKVVENR